MPETKTDTVEDLTGVAGWATQNASSEDQTRIRAIIDTYAKAKLREFATLPTQWEIDWFYKDSAKRFYRIALINAATHKELWAYS
jgi:hypothetical protein